MWNFMVIGGLMTLCGLLGALLVPAAVRVPAVDYVWPILLCGVSFICFKNTGDKIPQRSHIIVPLFLAVGLFLLSQSPAIIGMKAGLSTFSYGSVMVDGTFKKSFLWKIPLLGLAVLATTMVLNRFMIRWWMEKKWPILWGILVISFLSAAFQWPRLLNAFGVGESRYMIFTFLDLIFLSVITMSIYLICSRILPAFLFLFLYRLAEMNFLSDSLGVYLTMYSYDSSNILFYLMRFLFLAVPAIALAYWVVKRTNKTGSR